MKFFGKRANQERQGQRLPSEDVRATENLSVSIWTAKRNDGRIRSDFRISRVNPETSEVYKTFRPRDLAYEFPSVIALLASSYAKKQDEPAEVRSRLSQLASVMEQLVATQGANGPDDDASDEETRILNI